MLRGRLVAGHNLNAQGQTGVGHQGAVVAMGGPSRLLGVVADDRAFLFAVKTLYRSINVEYPRRGQQGACGFAQVLVQPGNASGFVDLLERSPGRIFGDELRNSKQFGMDAIIADGGNALPKSKEGRSPVLRASPRRCCFDSSEDNRQPTHRIAR